MDTCIRSKNLTPVQEASRLLVSYLYRPLGLKNARRDDSKRVRLCLTRAKHTFCAAPIHHSLRF